MATVYIQPGTGTGTGTEADPYFFSQLSTAETAAGSGGTILFTDGNYGSGASGNSVLATFDAAGVTYKALNPNKKTDGAYFQYSALATGGLHAMLEVGSDFSDGITFDGFYVEGFRIVSGTTSGSTTPNIINNCHINTIPVGTLYTNEGIIGKDYSSSHNDSYTKVTNCTFHHHESKSNGGTVYPDARWEFTNCSFNFNYTPASGQSSTFHFNGINRVSTGNIKNCVIVSDTPSGWSSSSANTLISKSVNCCFHDINHSATGGTNNIYVDPVFVNRSDFDLRLRPTSPCIGAGTAS
jgi:hypothetical protein